MTFDDNERTINHLFARISHDKNILAVIKTKNKSKNFVANDSHYFKFLSLTNDYRSVYRFEDHSAFVLLPLRFYRIIF